MANSMAKSVEIMFENMITGFEASTVVAKEVKHFEPEGKMMQRAGDVVYRPQQYNADIVNGLDVSLATRTDVIQRQVPSSLSHLPNAIYELDAKEMRDESTMIEMGKAAGARVAAQVDSTISSLIVAQAGIVIKSTSAFDWDDAAQAEALLLSRGAPAGISRKLVLNPFDYKSVASELGGRSYTPGAVLSAYEKSKIPGLAGFDSFRADIIPTQTVTGTVSGTTINGANQKLTVAAMSGDLPQDNRRMVLNVAGANIGNIKAGDKFTCGINAVHNITKDDTGQLMTFTIVSVAGGGANLTIQPAMVTSGPYQNVTASPTNGASLTFLNTATKSPSLFWCDGAIELLHGRLAFPTDQGVQVKTASTGFGLPIMCGYGFNVQTGKTFVRFSALHGATILNPELAGVILCNQV